MNKWDVVLLRYPFTDLSASKVRPALVISPDSHNQTSQDGMFICITSNTAHQGTFDLLIEKSHKEFSSTGLRTDSVVRVGKIFTLSKTLIAVKLGNFGAKLKSELEPKLRAFLELPGEQLKLELKV